MTDPTLRAPLVRSIVRRLGGRPCVWIAPPLWGAGDTGLLPVIRQNCAPCRFMDTPALVRNMPRLSDHIHPTIPAREAWAKYVVEWLVAQRDLGAPRPWDMLSEEARAQQGPDPVLDFAAR